ncbi:hypothetical protein WMY93_009984 [Mugilogobius chulae]|uniref:Uncharacterized protein n=1 Tax=Mugilogobius chulae TaxID=88201 RepID=A0AAW0P7E8_9GOBI
MSHLDPTPRSRSRTNQSQSLQPYVNNDNLNNALGSIRVLGLELMDKELKPHLTTVLHCIRDKPLVRKGFSDSGLVQALISVLSSPDQDLLIHSATALSRMCYDNSRLQDQCLRCGAVPRLVSILFRFSERPLLEEACLLALCNLSGLGLSEEGGVAWERGVAMRPGECTFTGSAPSRSGWAGSWVTVVRACQFAPGQFSVNVEVMRRCSPGFLGNAGVLGPAEVPLLRGPDRLQRYKVLKHWTRNRTKNRTRTRSLKTRMFHTLLMTEEARKDTRR